MAKTKIKKRAVKVLFSKREKEILSIGRYFTKSYVGRNITGEPQEKLDKYMSGVYLYYDNSVRSDFLRLVQTLGESYYSALRNYPLFRDTKKDLLAGNVIDMSKPLDGNYKDIIKRWGKSNKFLYSLPCFNTGTIIYMVKDIPTYVKWELLEVDVEQKLFYLILTSYFSDNASTLNFGCNNTWMPGYRIFSEIKYPGGDVVEIGINTKQVANGFTLETILMDKLGWSDFEKELWKTTIARIEQEKIKYVEKEEEVSYNSLSVNTFLLKIQISNILISINQPTIKNGDSHYMLNGMQIHAVDAIGFPVKSDVCKRFCD